MVQIILALLALLGLSVAAASARTDLRVWFPGTAALEIDLVTNQLVPAFEAENPDVNVTVEFVAWGDLSPRLTAAFAGGVAPDVFGHGEAATAAFVAAGRALPLDPYIEALSPEDRRDLIFLDAGMVDGQRYIMTLRQSVHAFAYRTDFFEEAGLDPNDPPATWEELLDVARRLTVWQDGRIQRSGLVLQTTGIPFQQAFANFLWQAGGELVSEDGSEVRWNSEAGVRALEFIRELYLGENPVAGNLGESLAVPPAQHPLMLGQAAIAAVTVEALAGFQAADPELAARIRVMPVLQDQRRATFRGGVGLFINADARYPEAAWRFIEFMTRPESLLDYTPVAGGVPIRWSTLEEIRAGLPWVADLMADVAYFRTNPNIPQWVQIRDILIVWLEEALLADMDSQTALDRAAEEANAVLHGGN